MIENIFPVDTTLCRLAELPLEYIQEAPDSNLMGWFIYLRREQRRSVPYRAFPGVYSTSFGVQLLSHLEDPSIPECRDAIFSGINYLVTQFNDSENLDAGRITECKQSKKMREIGHHDFKLIMKLCAVLEARNALASIVQIHQEYGQLLHSHREDFDRVATRLIELGQERRVGGTIHLGWPWHALTEDAELDPIPTSHVLLALTAETVRGTGQWLANYDCVVNYLKSVIEAETATLVYRVEAAKTLLLLEKRLDQSFLESDAKEHVSSELQRAFLDISNLPWQEVMHYQVPSQEGTLSHYKPWIWMFPRLEFAECLILLEVPDQRGVIYRIASDIVYNVRANKGKALFLRSVDPTLLASLRAAEFLELFKLEKVSNLAGKISFATEHLSRLVTDFVTHYPRIVTAIIIVWFLSWAFPFTKIPDNTAVYGAMQLLMDGVTRMLSVWPIWVFVFLVSMGLSKGEFGERLKKTLGLILGGVFLDLIINLLASP